VIKPSLACTANCPTCHSRRELHRELSRQRLLTFRDWQDVLEDARDLGVWQLTISGGEPTLYPRLAEIIRIGRSYGWLVRLNSNGDFAREGYGARLVEAGLNVVDISLYSAIPALHDSMRARKGLWHRATANIAMFAQLADEHPPFKVMTQTILCRENYRDFGELVKLHHRLGSSGLLVSYLEGDFDGEHLLSAEEIQEFRSDILPAALEVGQRLDNHTRELAISALTQIFSPAVLDAESCARGVYRQGDAPCSIPRKQALILANGDVHPCNIVEYTHDAVVGNLFSSRLRNVWNGDAWQQFRLCRHQRCSRCPMNHHVYVPLKATTRLRGAVTTVLNRLHFGQLDEKIHPAISRARTAAARTFGPRPDAPS